MKLFTTVLASACLAGMLGAATVSAQAQAPDRGWDHHDQGWHGDHHDWHADRDGRWHHPHAYGPPPPRVYGYYAPPPVYYGPPGAVVTVP